MVEITDDIYLGKATPNSTVNLSDYYTKNQTDTLLNNKQDTLVSGENIKTINGISLTGEGNIEVGEGGTITVNQVYDGTSTYAQSGTAVAEGLLTVANKNLSNLSADGQMIINSANGTISNCILEIPQNVKCTITGGVITLSSGSILTNTGSTYATITLASDQTYTFDNSLTDGNYLLCSNGAAIQEPLPVTATGSGASNPADGSTYTYFFNTTDKLIYKYADGAWSATSYCYPFAEITVASGVVSFAKDSNDRDIIFNGACFIGGHAVIYPGIKSFTPEGLEDNGTLHSALRTAGALSIVALSSGTTATGFRKALNSFLISGEITKMNYAEFNNRDEAPLSTTFRYCYIKNENRTLQYASGSIHTSHVVPFIFYEYDGTAVSDFTIQQPVKTVNTYMLDKKQNDITTIAGYDATKTQTLKNVSGTLTWVDD